MLIRRLAQVDMMPFGIMAQSGLGIDMQGACSSFVSICCHGHVNRAACSSEQPHRAANPVSPSCAETVADQSCCPICRYYLCEQIQIALNRKYGYCKLHPASGAE